MDPDHAFWEYFVIREMELQKIYPYTKFEVSGSIRSKFPEGVSKFKNSTPVP